MTRRTRLLLVDDQPGTRHLLRLTLEETGQYDVAGEAADGADAVVAAYKLRPDAILLDLSMPGMNGLEALPLLLEACPRARVVVHSGFENEFLTARAMQEGAHGFLEKGLPPEAFVAQLQAMLSIESPAPAAVVAQIQRNRHAED